MTVDVAPTVARCVCAPDVPVQDVLDLRAVQTRAGGFGAAAFSPEVAAAPADWRSQIDGPDFKGLPGNAGVRFFLESNQ